MIMEAFLDMRYLPQFMCLFTQFGWWRFHSAWIWIWCRILRHLYLVFLQVAEVLEQFCFSPVSDFHVRSCDGLLLVLDVDRYIRIQKRAQPHQLHIIVRCFSIADIFILLLWQKGDALFLLVYGNDNPLLHQCLCLVLWEPATYAWNVGCREWRFYQ